MREWLYRIAVTSIALAALTIGTVGSLWALGPRVTAALDDDVYHLLVLGSDNDPHHGANGGGRGTNALEGRADAIHLLSVSADRTQVSIVSFPRDSVTSVPGFGTTRINAGLVNGPDNMVAAVEGLTGVDVDDWAVTSFSGFVNAIDEMGRIRIDVEQRLNDSASGSNLQPGEQVLTGWSSLAYSRDRKSRPNGDMGRSTGQANVLRAVHAQKIYNGDLATLMGLIDIAYRNVETSIPAHKMVILASIASQLPPENVTHEQLTGALATTSAGASVVRLNSRAASVFEELQQVGVLVP